MMRLAFLIILLLLQSSIILAQDYQLIRSDRTVFYEEDKNVIFALGIDSLEVIEGDSIFYPFRRIDDLYGGCLSPFSPSFFGYQVIIKKDGYNLLFNKHNDTIKIKTDARLGESWTAFEAPNQPGVVGSVTDHQTFNFLGRMDSVKTIQFKGMDNLESYLPYTIEISKNYGLINITDLRSFPIMKAEPKQVLGFTNPETGIQNITWFDIYDFQVGDQFHIRSQVDKCKEPSYTIKKIITILERTDSFSTNNTLESIKYVQKVEKSALSIDTVNKIIKNGVSSNYVEPNFDQLPGYPYGGDYSDGYTRNFMILYFGEILTKSTPGRQGYICANDSCWFDCIIDGSNGNWYYKGLGGPYQTYQSGFTSCDGYSYELVYFEKGNSLWGTPLDLTAVPEFYNAQIQLNIFPNPASNYIQVQTSPANLPATFELFGMQGERILIQKISSPNEKIKLNNKNAGIVVVKITDKAGDYNSKKVLIKR